MAIRNHTRLVQLAAGVLLLAAAANTFGQDCDQDYCIDWYNISSGGVILADDGNSPPQWQISGTIGQWNATEARELSGGQWRLTGGFWGMTLEELADLLFRDRFEDE